MADLQHLGKYQILEEIGRGGYATVFRALDTTLEREVALKVLKPGWTDDPKAVERFMREARAASRLDYAGIVTIYDVGSAEGRLYIAMKLLPGQSLDRLIKSGGSLSWARTLQITAQVADALDYAHGKGLIHRDIKPANIVIDENDRAVLTDFGLVRGAEQASLNTGSTGGVLGTPEYIPPEVWEGQPATKASDIYALGCVVYEMLIGCALFAAETGAAVMRKHVLTGPEFPANWPPGVPGEVSTVLRKALAREGSERYASAGGLVGALRKCVEQEASEAAALALQKQREAVVAPAVSPDGDVTSNHPRAKTPWGGIIGFASVIGVVLVIALFASLNVFAPTPAPTATTTPESTVPPRPTEISVPTTTVMSSTATSEPTITPTRMPGTSTRVPSTPTPAAIFGFGSTQVSAKDGMTLLYVPAGEFLMGAADSDKQAGDDEKPPHKVYLDAYWIDQTEVTNAMYAKCVAANKCQALSQGGSGKRASYYGTAAFDNYPVLSVTWNDATAYCDWVGRRLPTEAEWEKAARGDDGRIYPWGDPTPDATRLNFNDNVGDTTEVGKYPDGASPYGAWDMAGNVWEWVKDWYDEKYYASSPARNPENTTSTVDHRVTRGGGWYVDASLARASNRNSLNPGDQGAVGFRCAR